ncbi:MAG: DUF917 domain-containing protein [Aigarchaeota archaeon]|nr:DUF917 domain-containing protein [Aigarchaeota archaeon]
MVRVLDGKSIECLVIGSTILGTGGGGDPEEGLKMLMADLEGGREIKIVKASELDPESIVACAYYCGSLPAPSEKREKRVERPGLPPDEYMALALEAMERRLGGKVSSIIPTEMGGGNTAVALHLASILGLPALDADQVGRSAPELAQSSYIVNAIQATPSVIVDPSGNLVVVEKYVSVADYEAIARNLAVASKGFVFIMDSPVKASQATKVAIRGTVSKAIKLGETVRQAAKSKKDPVDEIVRFLNGFKLFSGSVARFSLHVESGFLTGETEIEGIGDWRGHRFKIWVKNENLIGWRDGNVVATAPDLICLVDQKGHGITNSNLKLGMKASVVGVKTADIWRTPRGIELFGPKHFGFELDYLPIEELAEV